MSAFVDTERARFGVEPICQVLDVSASAYYQRRSGQRSQRAVEDERLLELIRQIHARNHFAYGSWRMWKALRRAGGPLCGRRAPAYASVLRGGRAECNEVAAPGALEAS